MARRTRIHLADNLSFSTDIITEVIDVLAKRGSGKALALDTPIPTTTGWTTMGEISVGDELFDENGNPCRVTYVAPIQERNQCFEVKFSDGSVVIADAEHLWLTETVSSRRSECSVRSRREKGLVGTEAQRARPQCVRRSSPSVVSTIEIRETLHIKSGDRVDRNHSIPVCGALRLPDADLLADPYTLGLWLGDGTAQNAHLTTADPEVLDHVRDAGYTVGDPRGKTGKAWSYNISKRNGVAFATELRQLGLKNNKHIPRRYLRSSTHQRAALLAGLMDSDGHVKPGSNSCEFYGTNEQLVDGVLELVLSLGWVARKRTKTAKLYGKDCGEAYTVSFRPTRQVFRLGRKASQMNFSVSQGRRYTQRMIVGVDPVGSVPVRCIAVDSDSHLFLAGSAMIPTHNTYTCTKLAEEMLDVGAQVVVVDPVGNWYGLRLGAGGDPAGGKDITVLGGRHGDIPLEHTSGALVAQTLVDTGISAVLDVSMMSKPKQRNFITQFSETLLEQRKRHPAPMHIFWEEAYRFMPQKLAKGSKNQMLEATEELVTMGRNFGIGGTIIAQRSAQVSKTVLTQAGVLLAMNTNAPVDRKVIESWVEYHGVDKQNLELSSLQKGDAYVWWPEEFGIKRIHVAKKGTFDASSTPKFGEKQRNRKLKSVDMDAFREAMSETIERVRSDDPRILKRRIAELERKLVVVEKRAEEVEVVTETVEVPVPDTSAVRGLVADVMSVLGKHQRIIDDLPKPSTNGATRHAVPVRKKPSKASPKPTQRSSPPSGASVKAGALRMLQAVASAYPGGMTRSQVCTAAGLKSKSGTASNYWSSLKTQDLIKPLDGNRWIVTEFGLEYLGDDIPEQPDTPEEKVEFWCQGNRLKGGAKEMLRFLFAHPDEEYSKEEFADACGFSYTSGTFSNYLSALVTNNLADRNAGMYQISADIMS